MRYLNIIITEVITKYLYQKFLDFLISLRGTDMTIILSSESQSQSQSQKLSQKNKSKRVKDLDFAYCIVIFPPHPHTLNLLGTSRGPTTKKRWTIERKKKEEKSSIFAWQSRLQSSYKLISFQICLLEVRRNCLRIIFIWFTCWIMPTSSSRPKVISSLKR